MVEGAAWWVVVLLHVWACGVQVGVRVEAEDMRTGIRYHCCSAYLTFVAQRSPPPRASLTGGSPRHAAAAPTAPMMGTSAAASGTDSMGSSTGATGTAAGAATLGLAPFSPPVLTPTPAAPPVPDAAAVMASTTTRGDGMGQPAAQPAGGGGGGGAPLLPRVIPATAEHVRVHQEAEARRQARLAERRRMRSDPELAMQAELCRLKPVTHRDGGPTLPPSIPAPWLLGCPTLDSCAPELPRRQSSPHLGQRLPSIPQGQLPSIPQGQLPSIPQGQQQTAPIPIPAHPSNDDDNAATAAPAHGRRSAFQTVQMGPPGGGGGGDGAAARVGSMSAYATSLLENAGPQAGIPLPRVRSRLRDMGGEGARIAGAPSGGQGAQGALRASRSSHGQLGDNNGGVACANEDAAEDPVCVISPSLTVAYMTQSIMPHHANTIGITFGGQVMRWMELCAYISASRLRAPHLLTAAIDSLTFVRPTCVGDILYVTSQVTAIFGSSMEVAVSVHGEDPQVGELFHCADGYVTVVAVAAQEGTSDGGTTGGYAPVRLPFALEPSTPAEAIQAKGALQRRDARLQLRAALGQTQLSRQPSRGMDR